METEREIYAVVESGAKVPAQATMVTRTESRYQTVGVANNLLRRVNNESGRVIVSLAGGGREDLNSMLRGPVEVHQSEYELHEVGDGQWELVEDGEALGLLLTDEAAADRLRKRLAQ